MSDRAIFLDRDGTLTLPRHYPSRPSDLVLYEGIGPRLRRLQVAGFRLVVVTNQAGIAKGYFTSDDLSRMHEHLRELLHKFSVRLDGLYYCPHHIDGIVKELAVECNCRKPEPGMLYQAADELQLSLQASWFVGDILDDIEAGNRAGCKTVLVELGTEGIPHTPERRPHLVAKDTTDALDMICAVERIEPGVRQEAFPVQASRP